MTHELAQVNVARLRAPLESVQLADFVAALDLVNASADAAPGFVWRLQDDGGNPTAIRAFEWDRARSAGVIVNMSGPTPCTFRTSFAPPHADDGAARRGHDDWLCPA